MHMSQLHTFIKGDPEFSMKFVSERGEVIAIERCRCTSFHSAGRTFNIRLFPSGQIRKVVRVSIIEINGKELNL